MASSFSLVLGASGRRAVPDGLTPGTAICKSFGSCDGEMAQARMHKDGTIDAGRATCGVDCRGRGEQSRRDRFRWILRCLDISRRAPCQRSAGVPHRTGVRADTLDGSG
jgi:hypothetical protein